MSLINDALKKAQRQRTGHHSATSQPPMPGGGAAPLRSAGGKSGSNPQLLLLGAGALLGVLIAAGFMIFVRGGKSDTVPAPTAAPVASTPAPKPAEPSVAAPVAFSSSVKSAEPTLVVKTEPAPAPVTNPAASPAAPSTAASAAATAPTPTVAVAPTPSEPAAPSLRMIEAIEALRVAGIRAGTGSDAKVLMNDRVYRIGDTVDHALGIKLTAVTANSLSFRDASGATYTRNF
jgi:hypothetical protein